MYDDSSLGSIEGRNVFNRRYGKWSSWNARAWVQVLLIALALTVILFIVTKPV